MVAGHRDAKNYPNLLQAVRVAHDLGSEVRLRCIGEGPSLEAHRRLADQLGIGHAVTFDPPQLDVLREMVAADLLVVASDYEGQPLVVVEALALGLPVVATAVGRIPELVGDGNRVVVPPRDAGRLGAAIATVAARAMTPAGTDRQPVVSRTLEEVADDLLRFYRGGRRTVS